MRTQFYSRAGWYLLPALILHAPLIQGGTPRLPNLIFQAAILLLGGLWAIEWGWKAPCQSLRATLVDGLLGIFLFWGLFSLLFAPYQHSAERALLLILCYALLYWWLAFHPSHQGLRWGLVAVAVQGVFQAALVWYQWWLGLPQPRGTFYNPNFTAGFLAVLSLLALGRIVFPPGGSSRPGAVKTALTAGGAAFMGGAILLTQSRGGILAFVLGGALLLGARSFLLAFGAIGGGIAGILVFPNPLTERLVDLSRFDVYAYSRISIWKSALKMMLDHPVFGIGLGQFKYVSPRYAFPVEHHWSHYSRMAESPHSEYLQVGAELGFFGLTVMVTALICVCCWFWRDVRKRPLSNRWPVVPFFAALFAALAHAVVDFPLHSPPIALVAVIMLLGLRLHGVEGPSWIIEFRFRKIYSVFFCVVFAVLLVFSARPVIAFWHYLGGLGCAQNLLQEKRSLEESSCTSIPTEESIEFLEKAVAFDPRNSAYHNALGSRYFTQFLKSDGESDLPRKGLFHANYAAQLNPNNHRYLISLGQAMESLYRRLGEDSFLEEAVRNYSEAALRAPRYYQVQEKLAGLYGELGAREKSEEYLRKVVNLEPNYLKGWFKLGTLLEGQGRLDEAKKAYRKGLLSARMGLADKVTTPYERALVDFDVEMFENALENSANNEILSITH